VNSNGLDKPSSTWHAKGVPTSGEVTVGQEITEDETLGTRKECAGSPEPREKSGTPVEEWSRYGSGGCPRCNNLEHG
jgi:hypothetical protein